jgi:predicted SAM-dependent methyltransferase
MKDNKIKLNLGCGSVRPVGWVNTDSSLNANIQRIPLIGRAITKFFSPVVYKESNVIYMNLNKKWRYSNNSIDIVYASHLYEHLSIKSSNLFLEEAYRTLKPGGVIRVVVPDLYQICKKYIETYEANKGLDTTEYIMWAINMHREGQYGNVGLVKKILLEWQGYPHQHKFMYDRNSLQLKFNQFNFVDVVTSTYGSSKWIEEILDVEGTSESYLSVYLEAKKPISTTTKP